MQIIQSNKLIPYDKAIAFMEQRVANIISGDAVECIWLLEHPPLITAGTSAKSQDILSNNEFPIHQTGRGGENTYHGPGQRIAYIMLNLAKRDARDLKKFVWNLEEAIIQTLTELNIVGERRDGRVGIWVSDNNGLEAKIAAIGIRVRKWVSFHGISINISPNLSHYKAIVPCGISEFGVTSLEKLGCCINATEFDKILLSKLKSVF